MRVISSCCLMVYHNICCARGGWKFLLRGDERRCVSGFLWRSVPASSRVNPLPQVPHRVHGLRHTCGSGFTREEAGTGNGSIPSSRRRLHSRRPLTPPCVRFRTRRFRLYG
ncbi:hypothetical protein RK21_01499 [Pseudomonas plecoglossicida]|nr:hypothetical protein RK21_01499 [Pseudomonas plecoglossicida]